MTQNRKLQYAVIATLIVAYVVVRLWRLTDSCLWFDEIFGVHAAEHSLDSILNFVALDLIHPPLFYVLLKVWINFGGENLFWLRLLPVIFSIIAIFPFIALCRELKLNFWTQALALFLLAVNGSLIKYAQEVRMYSLLMCLSLFSMWLFARYFNRGKNFAALVIVNVLMVYTHYFGWFVVVSEVVFILWFQRVKWRRILTMFGIVSVSFLPWAIAILHAIRNGSDIGQNIGWMSRPGIREIVFFIFDLIEPFYSQASTSEPASMYRVSIPILLIVGTLFIAYFFGWKGRGDDDRQKVLLILIFVNLPIVGALVASWLLPYSIWGTRHLIVVFAPLVILSAWALTSIRWRFPSVAFATFVVLFTGYAFSLQAARSTLNYSWCGFETIGFKLEADGRGPVYVFEDLAAYHLWFAFRTNPDEKSRGRVTKVDQFPGLSEDKAFFIPRGLDEEYLKRGELWFSGQFWVVYRASAFDPAKPPLDKLSANGFNILLKEEYHGDDMGVFAVFVGRPDKN